MKRILSKIVSFPFYAFMVPLMVLELICAWLMNIGDEIVDWGRK